MQLYLNELSTKKQASSIYEAEKWGITFIKICDKLKKEYKFDKIFIPQNVYYEELFDNFPISKIFNSNNREIITRMKNLKQVFISETIISDNFDNNIYKYHKINALGLGLSFFNNTFSVSFISEDEWKKTVITLDNKLEVKNISFEDHFVFYKEILDKKISEQLEISNEYDFSENPLAFAEESNKKFKVAEELDRIKKLDRASKRAEYQILCTKIAQFNHWIYDDEISKLNTNSGQIRSIFKIGEGSKTFYLSIDIENGPFELFKRDKGGQNASHLGEFSSITGKKNSKNEKKHPSLKLKK